MADKPVTREEKYLAYLTGDYKGELPKPITRKEKYLYELCLKGIGGEISQEEIKNAVNEYLENNPVKPGATTEQAQQIEQNKTDISSLKVETSSLKGDLDEQIGVKKSYRNEFIKGAYINGTQFTDNGGFRCLLLDVKEGQKYHYWGAIKLNICVVINFTDDNGVNKGYYDRGTDEVTIINDKQVIVPQGATKMYVTFIVNDPQDYQFDLYKYEYGVRSKWYGKKAMCIGDSITQGVYWNGTKQADSDYPYTFYLKEILEFSEVKNLGVSGMTIANNSNQVRWLWLNDRLTYDTYKEDNDLVIIFAGTNDFGYSTPLGDFTSIDNTTFYGALNNALFTLLNRFPNKYKKHRLVLCTPIHRTEDTTPNNVNLTLKDYRDAIIKVAERFAIDCIDLYSISGFNAIGGIGDTNALLSDGLHPTKIIGYQRLGEVIADKLNNI